MLQQTVVTAALEHYRRWMARWPDVTRLAQASEAEVLRLWEGLGYYSRGRNLLKAAQVLAGQGLSNLPLDYQALRRLPGLGDYTASAILSFSANLPWLTLDANLKRVFQRLLNQADWTPAVEATVRTWAGQAFNEQPSRAVNQGLMQLGQLVCLPRTPRCPTCPLAPTCQARRADTQDQIPPKKVRLQQDIATEPLVVCQPDRVYLARPVKGRFSHLWLFPPAAGVIPAGARALSPRLHTYTVYKDRLSPHLVESDQPPPLPETWVGQWVSFAEAEALPMPAVYRKIWQEAENHLKFRTPEGPGLS